MAILTLDVGQKYVRYGFFSEKGTLTQKGRYLVPMTNAKEFYESIADLVKGSNIKLKAISISFPGFIDGKKGVAILAGNQRFLDGHNIINDLHHYVDPKIEVYVENNANCAAIAEKLNGNAQDVSDFIVITLGNGVGGGIFINNHLLRGSTFSAGEFGLMITDFSKHKFNNQHVLASARALIEAYSKMRGIPDNLVEPYQIMSELDDPKVRKIVDKWATYVAVFIFNLVCTLNPQRVLIGGEISQNTELIPIIQKQLELIPSWQDLRTEIRPCHFFNDASLYGAYWAYIGSKK